MTKALAFALKKIRDLPPERQDEAAAMLLALAEQETSDFELTAEQLAELDAAIAEADQGKFVADEELDALFRKYGA